MAKKIVDQQKITFTEMLTNEFADVRKIVQIKKYQHIEDATFVLAMDAYYQLKNGNSKAYQALVSLARACMQSMRDQARYVSENKIES